MIGLIEQRDPVVPLCLAREVLGVSRGMLYRHRWDGVKVGCEELRRDTRPRRKSVAHGLSESERQVVLGVLLSPEFSDQPPAEVFATLLDRGEYVASTRTMYRVLAEAGCVRERRNVRTAMKQLPPSPLHVRPPMIAHFPPIHAASLAAEPSQNVLRTALTSTQFPPTSRRDSPTLTPHLARHHAAPNNPVHAQPCDHRQRRPRHDFMHHARR